MFLYVNTFVKLYGAEGPYDVITIVISNYSQIILTLF